MPPFLFLIPAVAIGIATLISKLNEEDREGARERLFGAQSIIDLIAQLGNLLERGLITREEFDNLKSQLLSQKS